MNNALGYKTLVTITVMISVLSVVFFAQIDNQTAFGFEENILVLQTGIISTSNQDYALSQEFDTRIIQDGRIMRLSGITTTGELYYLYQKIVGDDTIVKGKILVNNKFISIIKSVESFDESLTDDLQKSQPITLAILQPQNTYWRQIYTINVKVFEEDKNPSNDYWYKEYLVSNIPILIEINHENGRHLTTIEGITNDNGYFRGQYVVRDNLDWGGKYNVHVVAGDDSFTVTQDLTTFIIPIVIGTTNSTGG